VEDFQVDAVADAMNTDSLGREASQGVFFDRKGVSYWRTRGDGDGGRVFCVRELLTAEQVSQLAKAGQEGLDATALVSVVRALCLLMVPVLAFVFYLEFLWMVVLCVVTFGISTLIFRRDLRYSLSDLVIVGINVSLPPTLVALVWHAAAPPSWDFGTIFCVAFIGYLCYVFFDTRKFLGGRQ